MEFDHRPLLNALTIAGIKFEAFFAARLDDTMEVSAHDMQVVLDRISRLEQALDFLIDECDTFTLAWNDLGFDSLDVTLPCTDFPKAVLTNTNQFPLE